jgi:predicted nicotinamide N-methyase
MAAVLAGGRVLATDWSPDATRLARENAARNGIDLDVLTCAWAEPEPLEARGPWDLILGADLLYERRNVGELLRLLPRLAGPRTEILLADPGRAPLEEFLGAAAERWAVTRSAAAELRNGAIYALTSPPRPAARGC